MSGFELRVVVDARIEYGRAGGVQQAIVALAQAIEAVAPAELAMTYATLEGLDGWLRCELADSTEYAPFAVSRLRRLARHLRHDRVGRAALATLAAVRARVASTSTTASFAASATSRLDALGADVVHFPTQRGEVTATPFVYQPWDLQHRHLPQLFAEAERTRREHDYARLCRAAAMVVVPTRFVADDVRDAYGVDEDKLAVIAPWSLKPRRLTPSSGRPSSNTAPPPRPLDRPYLLFPAQAWPHKNHNTLLQALAVLRARGQSPTIVCPGATGDGAREVHTLAGRLGLSAQLVLPGYVDDHAIAAWYSHARGLIFPSLFEGWGYPVVEAMAASVPVACAQGAYLDAAAGDAALRFDARDPEAVAEAIEVLWNDERRRAALTAAGAAHVGRFAANVMGPAYRDVYARAANQASRRLAVGAKR